jgi:hypothetical protein
MSPTHAVSRKIALVLLILLILFIVIVPAYAKPISPGGLVLPVGKSLSPLGFSRPFFPADPIRSQDRTIANTCPPEPSIPLSVSSKVMVQTEIASLPFSFIPNTGQIDDRNISFTVKSSGSTLYFTPGEVILDNVKNPGLNGTSSLIRQSFPGANPDPVISGMDELPGKVNYLIGRDPSGWRSNIPTYGAVMYHNLYPGIDLRYFGNEGYLKR